MGYHNPAGPLNLGPHGDHVHASIPTWVGGIPWTVVGGWIRYAGPGPANVPLIPEQRRQMRLYSSVAMHAATLSHLSETSHLASNSNKILSAQARNCRDKFLIALSTQRSRRAAES